MEKQLFSFVVVLLAFAANLLIVVFSVRILFSNYLQKSFSKPSRLMDCRLPDDRSDSSIVYDMFGI